MSAVPPPTDARFEAKDSDIEPPHLINVNAWAKCGAWKHRQFGREVQLRNPALPHLALDLFRSEAEDLHAALSQVLGKPMPLPYELSAWERLKQWWMRRVWARKHHAQLEAARASVIDQFTRQLAGEDWKDRVRP